MGVAKVSHALLIVEPLILRKSSFSERHITGMNTEVIKHEEELSLATPPQSPLDLQPKTVGAFAKLVRTIQVMKKWVESGNEDLQSREDFLKRFNMGSPNIDDAFIRIHDENDGWVAVSKRRTLIFNPMNIALYSWLIVVSIAVLYNLFVIIARQTFHQLQDTSWKLGVWLILDYITDIVYLIDVIIQFRTGFLEHGLLVTDARKMAVNYIKSTEFKLDVASLIPFDWLYAVPVIGSGFTIVRVNRIFRIHRMFQFFRHTENHTNFPNVLRSVILILFISLIIHWNACFYFLISKAIGFGTDSWVYPGIEGENATTGPYSELSRQYLVSLYWSTLTLTTIGEVPGPVIEGEYVFVIVDFLVGVLIFATIIGMVGEIITNINARRTEFQNHLDSIKHYMKYRAVDKKLKTRVIKWFNYVWTTNHSLDEQKILESLPDKLRAEIAIHVHFDALSRVKIFEECEPGLLEELVLKLKPQVYSPGDFICRIGDVGKEMFFVKHGKLLVLGEDDQIVATLGDGSYFGEISILNISGSGNRRTASVMSVGYSDLFCLSKYDLLEVFKEYPEAKSMLEEKARTTLKKDGVLDESTTMMAPNSDRRRNNQEIEKMELSIEDLEKRLTRFLGEYNRSQMKLKQRIFQLETKYKTATQSLDI